MMSEIVNHTSTDIMVLQWRVRSGSGVPEREWFDTTMRESRHHGAQAKQAEAMLTDWRSQYPAKDEEQRVVNRITHVTDYAIGEAER